MRLDFLRENYDSGKLDESELPKSPMELFEKWMEDAINPNKSIWGRIKNFILESLFGTLIEPNAMTLSTVDSYGNPNSRTVLLKGIYGEKLKFYTNYDSDKSNEIESNNNVTCTFWWPPLQRQVIVKGIAEKLDKSESNRYFNSRPRSSKLGAHVSHQSQPIVNRDVLENQLNNVKDKYKNFNDDEIPMPTNWGGFGINITQIEFWQGRVGRLHDRIRYTKNENGKWEWNRISP